jgi:hypothetical protein
MKQMVYSVISDLYWVKYVMNIRTVGIIVCTTIVKLNQLLLEISNVMFSFSI